MLQPFLFIGIGGSGGKTLRTLREELRDRLEEVGWGRDRSFPAMWRFLHIDVPTVADGDDPDLPEQLPPASYVGLVGQNINYTTIDRSLTGSAAQDNELLHSLVGWRPNPAQVTVAIQRGAGQYRTLGRVITLSSIGRVIAALQESVDALQTPDVRQELIEVSSHFGDDHGDIPSPTAVVVSSLAGGSGSGAFLDVCDILRAFGETWCDDSLGVLFAPDVFHTIPQQQRRGVQANALAAMAELLAAFWNRRAAAPGEFAAIARAGLATGAIERRGPKYPFIVGAANGVVNFRSQNDVYRAMGKALAAWVVSPILQDQISAYLMAGFASAGAVQDSLPLKGAGIETPFSAMGFSRVSLGRDRFLRYAEERLARLALERSLRRHQEGVRIGEEIDNETAIENAALARVHAFIDESALDERGEERNQILEKLRPGDQDARRRAVVDQVLSDISAGRETRGATAREWASSAIERLKELSGRFADQDRSSQYEGARDWVERMPRGFCDLVARTVAQEGFPVTLAVLDKVDAELEFVIGELPEERRRAQHYAGQLEDWVNRSIMGAGDAQLVADNPQIRQGIERGLDCMIWRAEGELRELTEELLRDFRANVVKPLCSALRGAQDTLRLAEQPRAQPASVVSLWPEGEVVPSRFEPAVNERLIAAPSTYPSAFRSGIEKSTKASDPDGAIREAVMSVILGDDGDGDGQSLITIERAWVPQNPRLHRDVGAAATSARFAVHLKATDLLVRARRWLTRPDTAMGIFVNETLGEYLDVEKVDPAELEQRKTRFKAELVAAVDASNPLVEIDNRTLTRVHDLSAPATQTFMTLVPFPSGSPGRTIIEEVLVQRDRLTPEIAKAFGDGKAERIDIYTLLLQPYEPAVFSSFVRPILDEWSASASVPARREEFWRWRRARPLPLAIPASPEVREAMVRGWFVARFLGQLTHDALDRISLYSPQAQRSVAFPHPLLGRQIFHEYEQLPAVLESLSLSVLEFSAGSSTDNSMLAYARLRDLGEDAQGSVQEFRIPNVALTDWIRDGRLASGVPQPPASSDSSDATEEERADIAEEYFEVRLTNYRQLFAEPVNLINFFDCPRVWELRADIEKGLEDLLRGVRGLGTGGGKGW